MSEFLHDIQNFTPKYALVQLKWVKREGDKIVGTCPLTALALDKGLVSEATLLSLGEASCNIILMQFAEAYPHDDPLIFGKFFASWDDLKDPISADRSTVAFGLTWRQI